LIVIFDYFILLLIENNIDYVTDKLFFLGCNFLYSVRDAKRKKFFNP